MPEEPKIVSHNAFAFYLFILLAGGLGFGWISWFLISTALSGTYPDIMGLGLGAFLGLLSLLSVLAPFTMTKLAIYRDRVILKSIFGYTKAVVYLTDIVSWTEIEKQTKYHNWTALTLYTKTGKFELSSSGYSNYIQIMMALTRGKPRNAKAEARWLYRNTMAWVVGLGIFCIICFYFAYIVYGHRNDGSTYSDLVTVTGTLSNKAEIEKGSKGSRSVKIKLKEYPDFVFQLSGVNYSAAHTGAYVTIVNTGDTLYIDVLKDAYRKKLSKEVPLSFWDKGMNYRFISIYGLRDQSHEYLSVDDYNQANKSDSALVFWFVMGVGLCIAVTIIYQSRKK